MSRFRPGLFYFFTLTLLFFAFDLKAQHSDMVDSTQTQVFAVQVSHTSYRMFSEKEIWAGPRAVINC